MPRPPILLGSNQFGQASLWTELVHQKDRQEHQFLRFRKRICVVWKHNLLQNITRRETCFSWLWIRSLLGRWKRLKGPRSPKRKRQLHHYSIQPLEQERCRKALQQHFRQKLARRRDRRRDLVTFWTLRQHFFLAQRSEHERSQLKILLRLLQLTKQRWLWIWATLRRQGRRGTPRQILQGIEPLCKSRPQERGARKVTRARDSQV